MAARQLDDILSKKLRMLFVAINPHTVALLGLTLFPFVFPDADEPGPGM